MPATTAIHARTSGEVVTLRGGAVLPLDAVIGAIDLEGRGFRLTATPDGRLGVGPSERLSVFDRAFIAHHVRDLVAIVRYCDAISEEPL